MDEVDIQAQRVALHNLWLSLNNLKVIEERTSKSLFTLRIIVPIVSGKRKVGTKEIKLL